MRRIVLAALAALILAPAAQAWTWPTDGRVVAPFVFDPSHPYEAGQHRGTDVAGALGEPVRAPAAGIVSFAGTVPGNGKSVTIETADGWSVTLTQLGAIAVAKGAAVAEGATVGAIGDALFVQLGVRHTADAQGYVDPAGLLPPRA